MGKQDSGKDGGRCAIGQRQGPCAGLPFTPARNSLHRPVIQPIAATVIPEDKHDSPSSFPVRQLSPAARDVRVATDTNMEVPSNLRVSLQVAIAIAMPSQHSSHRQTPGGNYARDHQWRHRESDRLEYTLGLYRCVFLTEMD
jgi:hypothetical protein